MRGADMAALAAAIERCDSDPAARLYDTSVLYQIALRRAEALELQAAAVAASPLLRVHRARPGSAALRVLALVTPGDLMANTPLEFIAAHLDIQLDLLFLLPGQPLPELVPDHDVMFFAASEPDAGTLARMAALFAAWPRPALNDPAHLPALGRDRLPALLAGAPGLCSPPSVSLSHAALSRATLAKSGVGGVLPGGGYPVLIRPHGSHAGIGLRKLDGDADLAAYLRDTPADAYHVTAFMEYRGADGCYRKLRIAFIDRQPHLCHLAVSSRWMVHYLNAGMAEDAAKRAEEARAMAAFASGFAVRHRDAFAALHAALPFDYYSIDCGELPDGRLLVFEADTAAIVHLMEPPETFAYKHAHMRGVFAAFGDMLRRRAADGVAAAA